MENPYRIENGRLIGPSVYHVPTSWKFYRRPSWTPDRPVAVVLHYTACLAADRPIVHLDRLMRNASIEYEAQEPLREACVMKGIIPDAVALTLQNANIQRKASWCLCIGLSRDGDFVSVAQYSPDFRTCGTMHAGPGKLWKWRQQYRNRMIVDLDGDLRWNGHDFVGPVVTAGGREQIIVTPNPVSIGIEIMNVGPLGLSRLVAHPSWRSLPVVKVNGRPFHAPSKEQLRTVAFVLDAIVEAYGVGTHLIKRHHDYVFTKNDPEPPFDVKAFRMSVSTTLRLTGSL